MTLWNAGGSVMGKWMNTEHWWSDNDREKLKYTKENLCLSLTVTTTHLAWNFLRF